MNDHKNSVNPLIRAVLHLAPHLFGKIDTAILILVVSSAVLLLDVLARARFAVFPIG